MVAPRDGVHLRSITPEATPEEVAAIVAALGEIARRQRAAVAPSPPPDLQRLSHWRAASRLTSRRVGMERGPWRLSGRLTRRVRA